MTAILYLALALHPGVDALTAQLGDPSFRVRDAAERQLSARMTYALAIRLERIRPVNPEAATRLNRLMSRFWANQYPPFEAIPFIDSLSWPNCAYCKNALTRHYYRRANGCDSENDPLIPCCGGVTWPAYRAATAMMVADLTRWRVPPAVVKPLLAAMKVRSDQWESERR